MRVREFVPGPGEYIGLDLDVGLDELLHLDDGIRALDRTWLDDQYDREWQERQDAMTQEEKRKQWEKAGARRQQTTRMRLRTEYDELSKRRQWRHNTVYVSIRLWHNHGGHEAWWLLMSAVSEDVECIRLDYDEKQPALDMRRLERLREAVGSVASRNASLSELGPKMIEAVASAAWADGIPDPESFRRRNKN